MTRRVAGLAAALAGAAALGAGAARAGETVEIRLASVAPRGSSWAKGFDRFARDVSARTGGRVKFKFYLGGTQGDEKDYIHKMKLGQLDGAAVTVTGLSMIRPEVWVLTLPGMFQSDAELDHARDQLTPDLDRGFAEAGFVILAWGDVGWEHVYTNVPLREPADLKKVKMWVWIGEENWIPLWRRLGVNGVPLGLPDVQPSLQTGLIDGCYGPPLAAVSFQWYAKVRYATATPLGYIIGAVLLRKDVIDRLSPEDRKVVLEAGRAMGKDLVQRIRQDNRRARTAMERAGVQFVAPGAELKAKLDEAARGVWDDLVTKKLFTRELLDRVKKYAAEARR